MVDDEKMTDDAPDTGKDEGPKESPCFLHDLAQQMFTMTDKSPAPAAAKEEAAKFVVDAISKYNMVPVYEWLVSMNSTAAASIDVEAMKKANMEKEAELEKKIKELTEDGESETDIRDALLAKADFFKSLADKARGLSQYRLTETKTVGVGPKLDLVLSVLDLALFWDDAKLTKEQIEKAHKLLEEGGDWERRNRLKVYEAVYLIRHRNFSKAASLLQASVATFTCVELMSYDKFIFYTVLVSVQACDRSTIKDKVVNCPEILQVMRNMLAVEGLLKSLHECQYKNFFSYLLQASDDMSQDRHLNVHYYHYIRTLRIKAYKQYIHPYSSVSLASMGEAFGTSEAFVERELFRFISEGNLTCKIDKIKGLVENQRPDSRNAMYQNIIKDGDLVLNRVQKLSRVINV